MSDRRFAVVVCRGPECGDRRGSAPLHDAFAQALSAAGARERCRLDWQSCFGRCSQGPNVLVREVVATPPRVGLAELPRRLGGGPRTTTALYNHVALADVAEIVDQHVVGGVIVRRLIDSPHRPASEPPTRRLEPNAPEVREDVKAR